MNNSSRLATTPGERDVLVEMLLRKFHRMEESSGYFFGAAQKLINDLDILYSVPPSSLPVTLDMMP